MTDQSQDLQTLLPERDVTVKGETIAVSPFKFGQLPKAFRLMRPLGDVLRTSGVLLISGTNLIMASDWPLKLPDIVAEGGEALIELLAFAIGKPREWFDDLDIDEGVALTRKVVEVNGDFFAKRIAPMLPGAVEDEQQQTTEQAGAPS